MINGEDEVNQDHPERVDQAHLDQPTANTPTSGVEQSTTAAAVRPAQADPDRRDGAEPEHQPGPGLPSPQDTSHEENPVDKTDQAALMGTALAAIFATVISPGQYTTFDIVAALALSCVLVGYYRPPVASGWEAQRKAIALGGAVALLGNLLSSYPVQQRYVRVHQPQSCDTHTINGMDVECVANYITVHTMPILTAVFFALGWLLGLWLIGRRRPQKDRQYQLGAVSGLFARNRAVSEHDRGVRS